MTPLFSSPSEEPLKELDRPGLSITLFGPVDLRLAGAALPRCRTRKGEWLLALLILRYPAAGGRSWLAGTLWPESREAQAQASLRQSLSDLRRVLGTEAHRLQTPSLTHLLFDPAGAEIDLLEFDSLVERKDSPSLERAVSLHRGPLLEGCG